MDHVRREALLAALATAPTVAEAARVAGWQRTYVARLLRDDPAFVLEVERRRASAGVPALPKRGERVGPQPNRRGRGSVELATEPRPAGIAPLPASAEPASPLVAAVAAGALEAVECCRAVLRVPSEAAGVLLAKNGAAKILLEMAGRPAPVGALRARAESADGRSLEIEGSGPGIEGLVARVLGGGASG